jgi:hypothetical protein
MARNLKTVSKFCESHRNAYTEGSLRWKIFNADSNGLAAAGAIVRDGRRVLIDEDRFFEWLDAQQSQAVHAKG